MIRIEGKFKIRISGGSLVLLLPPDSKGVVDEGAEFEGSLQIDGKRITINMEGV